MTIRPHFLARFGLDDAAGEADLKRAYARELKLIDQEADPAAFQALREARDAAQAWLKSRHGPPDSFNHEQLPTAENVPAGNESAQPEPPAPRDTGSRGYEGNTAIEKPIAPSAPSAAVFHEFIEHLERRQPDAAQMRHDLNRYLGDPRLAEIDAHELFEQHIVEHLALGWKPGNDVLFNVASNRFEWLDETRSMARFGPAGQRLERVIREVIQFQQQREFMRAALLGVMQSLRVHPESDPDNPTINLGRAELLAAQYPHMMATLSNLDNLANWRRTAAAAELAKPPRPAAPPAEPPAPRSKRDTALINIFWFGASIVVMLVIMLRFISFLKWAGQ